MNERDRKLNCIVSREFKDTVRNLPETTVVNPDIYIATSDGKKISIELFVAYIVGLIGTVGGGGTSTYFENAMGTTPQITVAALRQLSFNPANWPPDISPVYYVTSLSSLFVFTPNSVLPDNGTTVIVTSLGSRFEKRTVIEMLFRPS